MDSMNITYKYYVTLGYSKITQVHRARTKGRLGTLCRYFF